MENPEPKLYWDGEFRNICETKLYRDRISRAHTLSIEMWNSNYNQTTEMENQEPKLCWDGELRTIPLEMQNLEPKLYRDGKPRTQTLRLSIEMGNSDPKL